MIKNLQEKLKFIELIDEMKNIKRACILKNGNIENDAEHSFHLAFMSMVFLDDFPELNAEKCFKLALLHDIVEIFAGDCVITNDEKIKQLKKIKEKEALKKLESIMGEIFFKKYKNIIEEYEENKTLEAKFIHQLDKIQGDIPIIMEGGSAYKKHKMTEKFIVGNNNKKIDNTFGFDKVIALYMNKAIEEKMFYIEK